MLKKSKQRIGVCHNPACPMCDVEQYFDDGEEFKCKCCPEPLEEILPSSGEGTKRIFPWKWVVIAAAVVAVGCAVACFFVFLKSDEKESLTMTLNKQTIELSVGESETVEATTTVQPSGLNVSLFYSSDNNSVASIDPNGSIQAIAVGEAIITVIAQTDNNVADTAYIQVVVIGEQSANEVNHGESGEQSSQRTKGPKDMTNDFSDIDWSKSVSVSDAEISATLNGLVGKHKEISSNVKEALEKCFAQNADVDKIGVNGSTLVNYHQPIKAYLESICASKYLRSVKVIDVRRNSIGRITYLKVQESHYRDI